MKTKEIKQFCRRSVLNPINERVMMYPIKKGCEFSEWDIVAVDRETCEACHPEQSNRFIIVGRAIRTVLNECGGRKILCRDGVIAFKNTLNNCEYVVQESDIGKNCYFEHGKIVSMNDNQRAVAGKILSVVEDTVIARIDIYEGEE